MHKIFSSKLIVLFLFFLVATNTKADNENKQSIQSSVIQLSDSCQGKLIQLTLNPVPPAGSSITWLFNDPSSGINNTAVGHTSSHAFFNKGRFTVQASISYNGSVENVYHTVNIEACPRNPVISNECLLKSTNSFTPNGDGKNDEYIHESTCPFEKYELSIFNRWGEVMFKSSNPTEKWDGKSKKEDCPDGQYLYLYKYTFVGQEAKTLNGYVMLLR
jgi:gliding motility-associated-like protein